MPKLSQGKNFTIPTPEEVIRQQHRLFVDQPERGMQLGAGDGNKNWTGIGRDIGQ